MNVISPICPYCQSVLDKAPSRKSKCKHCRKDIYVKYSPSNKNKRLVTESEAQRIDEEWNTHNRDQEILRMLNSYRLNIDDLNQIKSEYGNSSVQDETYITRIEIGMISRIFKDHKRIQTEYWILGRLIMLMTDLGVDSFEYQLYEKKLELKRIIDAGIKTAEIFCYADCPNYSKLNSLKSDVFKEYSNQTIPSRECTRDSDGNYKVCMCSYKPYFE